MPRQQLEIEPIDAVTCIVDYLDSATGIHCRRFGVDQDSDRKLIHIGTLETNADDSKTRPLVQLENFQQIVAYALLALAAKGKKVDDWMSANARGCSDCVEWQHVPRAVQRRSGVVCRSCEKLAIWSAALYKPLGVVALHHALERLRE